MHPKVIIIAGPNGVGKSTAAPILLRGAFRVAEFVNADAIARGLSLFSPENAAFDAARAMLKRLDELAGAHADFAFETTLASRSFAPKLESWISNGYRFHLIFLWLPDSSLAEARVAGRTLEGGHFVPAETIHRRYRAGLENFFELYKPLAFSWRFYDNSIRGRRRLIAAGRSNGRMYLAQPELWEGIQDEYSHGR